MKNKQAELIKNMSDQLLLLNVYLTQVIVLVIAVVVGFFLFDNWTAFIDLFYWNSWDILVLGAGVGFAIVIYDLVLMKWLPDSYFDDGGINERIFRHLSYVQIFFVTITIAVSEELLFRGVIQHHSNIWVASLIFALVHYRYMFNPFLLVNVTVLSFIIGLLFEYTGNLFVTITAHFIIDFLLGVFIKNTYKQNIDKVV
ncbi:MAG: lysostaphin resistance A-like protein [Bacillus sp. (in: firmicutes)]